MIRKAVVSARTGRSEFEKVPQRELADGVGKTLKSDFVHKPIAQVLWTDDLAQAAHAVLGHRVCERDVSGVGAVLGEGLRIVEVQLCEEAVAQRSEDYANGCRAAVKLHECAPGECQRGTGAAQDANCAALPPGEHWPTGVIGKNERTR